MANIIKQKRGTTDPGALDLVVGELAINTTDGGVFTKTDGGTVVEVGAGKVASYNDPVGGQNVDGSTADVRLSLITNTVYEDSIYSNSGGVITVAEAGVYEIYVCAGLSATKAQYRYTARMKIRQNGVAIAEQVGAYVRVANGSNDGYIACETIHPLAAGDTIDFTIRRISGVSGNGVTAANTSRILIKKLA